MITLETDLYKSALSEKLSASPCKSLPHSTLKSLGLLSQLKSFTLAYCMWWARRVFTPFKFWIKIAAKTPLSIPIPMAILSIGILS